jgi:methylmalonyl-CoA mutase
MTTAELPSSSTRPQRIRMVTAASLFDGHDAAINVMRRLLQAQGAEVIHLGHDRSVDEIVSAAIQEDAHGIAVSSYQGGHLEFFGYMVDRLRECMVEGAARSPRKRPTPCTSAALPASSVPRKAANWASKA